MIMGRDRVELVCFWPRRWMRWKLMSLTVSVGRLSCLSMKSWLVWRWFRNEDQVVPHDTWLHVQNSLFHDFIFGTDLRKLSSDGWELSGHDCDGVTKWLVSCVSASIWCWLYSRLLQNCWNSLCLNESNSVCPIQWLCCLRMWTCQIPWCSTVVSVMWVVKRRPMKRMSPVCVVFWLSESVPWWRVYCSIRRCRLQGDPGQYFKSSLCSRRKEQEFKWKGWKIE